MVVSGLTFLGGSLSSVIPFAIVDQPRTGLAIAAVLTAAALFAVGATKSVVTKTATVKAGLENLIIAGIGGLLAFWVGLLFDKAVG
jgi:VIT1/CCC1 family predicted Fe2+/Mn2+ transporter